MTLKKNSAPAGKKKPVIYEWLESAVIAFILAMIIRAFIIQAFKIPTGSMRPTLLEGDAILVNKFIYGARVPFLGWQLPALRQPKRGDVVVFIFPKDSYFVLGDNSASSQDSRYWGFVPKKNMLGKAIVIYWPPQRMRIIK